MNHHLLVCERNKIQIRKSGTAKQEHNANIYMEIIECYF